MPRERPISPRIVLISFSDFLPKFFVLRSSASVFWTRSAIVRMFAVLRQFDARTDSSSSSTLRKRFSLSSVRGPARGLDVEVHALDRREVGVEQDGVDRQRLGLALFGRDVAAAALDAHLH